MVGSAMAIKENGHVNDYRNDHPLRDWAIKRYFVEIMGLSYFEKPLMDKMNCYRYREIIRPLIVKDIKNGMRQGYLTSRYKVSRRSIEHLIKYAS